MATPVALDEQIASLLDEGWLEIADNNRFAELVASLQKRLRDTMPEASLQCVWAIRHRDPGGYQAAHTSKLLQLQSLAERDGGFDVRVELNFHGTPHVASVVKRGFDLSKVSGQGFGSGIYTSKHAGVSHNYIQDRQSEYRYLILVQCIKVCERTDDQKEGRRPRQFARTERQYQQVVTNVHEICKDVTYCIPLYVIKYAYGTAGTRPETANCYPSHTPADRRAAPFAVHNRLVRKRRRSEDGD